MITESLSQTKGNVKPTQATPKQGGSLLSPTPETHLEIDSSVPLKTDFLSIALSYAGLGLPVFPLKPRGKTPLTLHSFKDATTDTAIIHEWWRKHPDANIAIYCRGLLVLDFDGQTGFQSKSLLEKERQLLPDTWVIKTGGGTEAEPKEQGGQYVYCVPTETEIKPGVGKYGYPNLDVRAGESYICAVPSVTRLPYQTIAGSPEKIAPAPGWLVDFILKANSQNTAKQTKSADKKLPHGQRNDYLFRLASGLRTKGLSEATIYDSVKSAYENDCDHEPPLDDQELQTISKQGSKYEPQPKQQTKTDPKDQDNGYHPEVKELSSIQAEVVKWLWYPYIPFGKLTLIEGDPGVGKSWLCLALMTAISLGHGIPGQTDLAYGASLIASAEDGLADTIKPRLSAMGADVKAIRAVDGLFTLDDKGFQWLEDEIIKAIPILLVIDPLVAYLAGDMDINKANQVRYATARLAHLADTYGIAIIAVRHLNKGSGLKPIYRGLGSIDFTAAARSVLLVGQDPDMPQIRGFTHIKSNLSMTGTPVGYELREGNFYWLDHSDLTTERILQSISSDSDKSALDEAKRFILDMLKDGECSAKDIFSESKSLGISEVTLKRAKKELSITAYREGEKGREGGGKWYWKLSS